MRFMLPRIASSSLPQSVITVPRKVSWRDFSTTSPESTRAAPWHATVLVKFVLPRFFKKASSTDAKDLYYHLQVRWACWPQRFRITPWWKHVLVIFPGEPRSRQRQNMTITSAGDLAVITLHWKEAQSRRTIAHEKGKQQHVSIVGRFCAP